MNKASSKSKSKICHKVVLEIEYFNNYANVILIKLLFNLHGKPRYNYDYIFILSLAINSDAYMYGHEICTQFKSIKFT